MRFSKPKLTRWTMLVLAGEFISCTSTAQNAHAALAAAEGVDTVSVKTSLKLAKTAANDWAIETDPAIQSADSIPTLPYSLSDYVPVFGSLSNSYDPTMSTLATDPNGNYDLSSSVSGLGAYEPTQLIVYLNNGSVTVNSSGTTTTGDPTSGEAGDVDVFFQLIPGEQGTALTADLDQFFFQIMLNTLSPDQTTPGDITLFASPTDSVIFEPESLVNDPAGTDYTGTPPELPDGSVTVTDNGLAIQGPDDSSTFYALDGDIVPTTVPEPISTGFLAIGSTVTLMRRRRR